MAEAEIQCTLILNRKEVSALHNLLSSMSEDAYKKFCDTEIQMKILMGILEALPDVEE